VVCGRALRYTETGWLAFIRRYRRRNRAQRRRLSARSRWRVIAPRHNATDGHRLNSFIHSQPRQYAATLSLGMFAITEPECRLIVCHSSFFVCLVAAVLTPSRRTASFVSIVTASAVQTAARRRRHFIVQSMTMGFPSP